MRPGDDVRAVWVLAILILTAAAGLIQTRYEHRILLARDSCEMLYRRIAANDRIMQESGTLLRAQTVALNDLKDVPRETSLPKTMTELVAMLDSRARAHHIQVVELEPAAAQGVVAPDPGHQALSATTVTIAVRGRFRDILQFTEDVPRHRTLLSIANTQMSLAAGEEQKAQPELDATLHASVYRLHMPAVQEAQLAAAR
jgi:hypothetical protein